ncbi:MAG: single-stranded-DNA-specific exonuclease RecJ, partial [Candidatus Omnitrophica bacterium]|nr:single-stranded-DNA-specific exonuclease RecJ [Candidatus Omnitrophota bacterium]
DIPVYIPHRVNEGYGLGRSAVNFIKENKIDLVFTIDCGTNDNQFIRELRNEGIEVIVLDHHQPKEKENFSTFIINPKLEGSAYKFKDLASAGVVFKFCQALLDEPLYEELDLVSLATVADTMPLIKENRIIVKEGLKRFSDTKKEGLKALIKIAGLEGRRLNSYFLGYILAPRLNASGRIHTAEVSLNLLLSKDSEQAYKLAEELKRLNYERQKVENKALEEAIELIEREVNFKQERVIVIAGDWHPGVIGIVASKIVDRYYRPAIVISLERGVCRGSARSIRDFHIFEALLNCQDILDDFGGHSQAGGFTIQRDMIQEFRSKINTFAENVLDFYNLIPQIDIDLKLKFSDLNPKVIKEIDLLEPFGEGNPEPLFYTSQLKLKNSCQVLRRETLKFWVTDGMFVYPVIAFGMSDYKELLEKDNGYFSLIYTLDVDDWQEDGPSSLILEARRILFDYAF